MIFIERNAAEVPKILTSEKVKASLASMSRLKDDSENAISRATKHKFHRHLTNSSFRDSLRKMFHDKCAFCETIIDLPGYGEISHFRPKSGAVDITGGYHPNHYWWLTYEWNNLHLSCRICNASKGNKFPILGKYAELESTFDTLSDERPLLLDPCTDYPSKFLVYNRNGEMASADPRGQMTIDIFNLNRAELVERRRNWYIHIKQTWATYTNDPSINVIQFLTSLLSAKTEYAGLTRQFLTQWTLASSNKGPLSEDILLESFDNFNPNINVVTSKTLKETFSLYKRHAGQIESFSIEDGIAPQSFHILDHTLERIEIKNIKAVQDLDINVSYGSEHLAPWTLLLGENGTGKSTILQVVALAFVGKAYRDQLGILASSFVRRHCKTGFVRLHVRGFQKPIKLTFSNANGGEFIGSEEEPKIPILAYGATRLLPREDRVTSSSVIYARVENLFNPFAPLADASEWLLDLKLADFKQVTSAILQALDLPPDVKIRRSHTKRRIEIPHLSVSSLSELSDGYQGVLAIVVDILKVMTHYFNHVEAAKGIVLIDEIGAHLHPRWRMKIIGTLREIFPRVQFLVSTHDPLCIRGIRDGEIAVLKRNSRGKVFQVTNLPSVSGMRVDQILTSEHFGLSSTIDPSLEDSFQRYYTLLRQDALSQDEESELAEVKEFLSKNRVLGISRRERMLLEGIDKNLAVSLDQDISDDNETGFYTPADLTTLIDKAF